jgi:hypothetical protein
MDFPNNKVDSVMPGKRYTISLKSYIIQSFQKRLILIAKNLILAVAGIKGFSPFNRFIAETPVCPFESSYFGW